MVLFIQSAHCQNIDNINKNLQDFSLEVEFRNSGTDKSRTKTEGTEYLDESFVNGEILTSQSENYKDVPMRYNVFRDKMEIKMADGNIYDLTDHTGINQILYKDRTLVYSEFDAGKTKNSGYLFVLYKGKSALYFRNIKIFMKAVEETNGITPTSPPKIVDKPKEYYVKIADGIPMIFNSKKELLDLFGNHASKVDVFIKKQKLKLNNDDDLIKILTYFDTL